MKRGVYSFKVRSYECGADARATLPTICNYLQEAASLNAETLGFSKGDFAAAGENVSWVLTRLVVRIARYPAWEETVTVETFPRGGRKIVAWRDFELKDGRGETLGVATSEWMLIDLASRKIVAVPESVLRCASPDNAPVLGAEPFSRFKYPSAVAQGEPLSFVAQKSQIDLNGHVNNVHYVAWMLEPCANACPGEMEIVFRSETFVGDEVKVETAVADGFTYHRVSVPDGRDHVVARTRWLSAIECAKGARLP